MGVPRTLDSRRQRNPARGQYTGPHGSSGAPPPPYGSEEGVAADTRRHRTDLSSASAQNLICGPLQAAEWISASSNTRRDGNQVRINAYY